MQKPYTGNQTDRCPLMGGKLCYKVCPTCKFQQEFTMTDNATRKIVKSVWDCAHTMQTQLMMEGNQLTIDVKHEVERHTVGRQILEAAVRNGSERGRLAAAPKLAAPNGAICGDGESGA